MYRPCPLSSHPGTAFHSRRCSPHAGLTSPARQSSGLLRRQRLEQGTRMVLFNPLFNLLCVTLLVAASDAQSQLPPDGGVAPLTKIPSEQWIQKVVGDMDRPHEPFVIRIHHDAG